MKNTLLVLGAIVIVILLALLFFKHQENVQNEIEMKRQHQDSLARHYNAQARLQLKLEATIKAGKEQKQKDSMTAVTYAKENIRLTTELQRARTPRVQELVDAEPELRYYIAMYDSLVDTKDLRIDSLMVEARVNDAICQRTIDDANALIAAKTDENIYLKNEIEKRDKEKKKKRGLLATLKEIGKDVGFFALGFILGKAS